MTDVKEKKYECKLLKTYQVDLLDQPCPLCPKGKFVDLKIQCHNIIRFLYSEHPYEENAYASWFQLASGIEHVKYISDLHDDLTQWCGPSIEYEQSKSSFHSDLITELTRFSFIWGGLECILNDFELPKYVGGGDGKIKRVNYYLTNHYLNKYPIPEGYNELVTFLKTLLSKSEGYENVDNLFIPDKNCSHDIIGLKAVYKIRNLFAHGALKFSEPEEYIVSKKHGFVRPLDIDIIQTSSRIVLLTLQMLLVLLVPNLNFTVTKIHEYVDVERPDAFSFLQNMHLKRFNTDN